MIHDRIYFDETKIRTVQAKGHGPQFETRHVQAHLADLGGLTSEYQLTA